MHGVGQQQTLCQHLTTVSQPLISAQTAHKSIMSSLSPSFSSRSSVAQTIPSILIRMIQSITVNTLRLLRGAFEQTWTLSLWMLRLGVPLLATRYMWRFLQTDGALLWNSVSALFTLIVLHRMATWAVCLCVAALGLVGRCWEGLLLAADEREGSGRRADRDMLALEGKRAPSSWGKRPLETRKSAVPGNTLPRLHGTPNTPLATRRRRATVAFA